MQQKNIFFTKAQQVIASARHALADLADNLEDDFIQACNYLIGFNGNIITMGVGKSSFIAKKLASTFASLGQKSFFIHPVEAGHGDFGNITKQDVVILVSNSGGTSEIVDILSVIRQRSGCMLAITGKKDSAIGREVDSCLVTGVVKESCYMGLAPTTSITVAGVLADALAVVVSEARNFSKNDFASVHPFGNLGKMLTKKVEDVMKSVGDCVVVSDQGKIIDSLLEMAAKEVSVAIVVSESNSSYLGLQSDSVIRQALMVDSNLTNVANINYVLNNIPVVYRDMLLQEVALLSKEYKGRYLPVLGDKEEVLGLFDMNVLN